MALYSSKSMGTEKYSSYAYGATRESKCMNCGKQITDKENLYSRRFCSEECRMNYFF